MLIRSCLFLFVLACFSLQSHARLIANVSYEALLKQADLVVLVEPISTKETRDPYPGKLRQYTQADFTGLDTRFKIHAVLKGGMPDGRELTLLHFKYSSRPQIIVNGARFARFITEPLKLKQQIFRDGQEILQSERNLEGTVCLAFLKKREDGRYEPVTDPYDSADSFRQLSEMPYCFP